MVWLNGWLFVFELSGCGFDSSSSNLSFSYISGNRNPETETLKKFTLFQELTWKAWKSNVSDVFLYKEAQFSKWKYFSLIIKYHFFSFYNIFLYTQQAFVFHLQGDFCNLHEQIVTFFSFSSLERFFM